MPVHKLSSFQPSSGLKTWVLVAQLWPTLCDPVDYNLPGSSVHGILQARILEWVAIPLPRGSSWPSDWILCTESPALPVDSSPSEPPGKPSSALMKGQRHTLGQPCHGSWTLRWGWTSDWITTVLKQSLLEALPVGQNSLYLPLCVFLALSLGTFGCSQIMGPPQKVLLVWDSSHSSTEEAWRNQLQPLKYIPLPRWCPFHIHKRRKRPH